MRQFYRTVLAIALLAGGGIHMNASLADAYLTIGDTNPKWTRTKDGKFDVIVDGATGRVAIFRGGPPGKSVVAVTLEGFDYLASSVVYVMEDPPIIVHARLDVSDVEENVIWIHKSDGTRLAIRGTDLVTKLRPRPDALAGMASPHPYWLETELVFGVGKAAFVTVEKTLVMMDLLTGALQISPIADEAGGAGAEREGPEDWRSHLADSARWKDAAREEIKAATLLVADEDRGIGPVPEAFEDLATRVW